MNLSEKQAIFDQVFKEKKGGRFDPSMFNSEHLLSLFTTATNDFNSLSSAFKKEAVLLRPYPEIHFDFIDDGKLGASAHVHTESKLELIGINAGAIVIIYDLFYRMLSHPNVFPTIGDASKEKEIELLRTDITSIDELLKSREAEPHGKRYLFATPIDPVRDTCAHILGRLAVKFLIDHEFTHLMNGHVHYVNRLTGLSFIDEIGEEVPCKISPIVYQGLELDADFKAIHTGLNSLFNTVNTYKELPEEYQFFFETQEKALFNWLFAIYSIFRLYWNRNSEAVLKKKNTYKHPPEVLRQIALFNVILNGLPQDSKNKLSTERIKEVMDRAYKLSELAFEIISGIYVPVVLIEKANTPEAREYLKYVAQIFMNDVLPELNKHSVVEVTG